MNDILFLTNLLPFPGNSGGTQTTLKRLESFIEMDCKIHLFFLITPETKEADMRAFKNRYGDKIDINFVLNKNNRRSLLNLLRSFFLRVPLNVYRNRCRDFKQLVKKFIAHNHCDCIISDHLEMFQYIPKKLYAKTILLEHNAEYMIWRRYARQVQNPILKIGIFVESERLRRYEVHACKMARHILVAPSDEEKLSKYDKNTSHYTKTFLPANDSMLSLPPLKNDRGHFSILYIGTLTWQANVQGLEWFIKEVLPLIKQKYPNVVFNIIGKYKNDFQKSDDSACVYHGFVDDLEPFYASANVFVCPLLFGSGIKIKILDSMYRGLPFVTTSVGAESIDLIDGEHCFIADDAKTFADDVIRLYEDDALWQKFSTAIRLLAKEKYTWEKENERVRAVIERVTRKSLNKNK